MFSLYLLLICALLSLVYDKWISKNHNIVHQQSKIINLPFSHLVLKLFLTRTTGAIHKNNECRY